MPSDLLPTTTLATESDNLYSRWNQIFNSYSTEPIEGYYFDENNEKQKLSNDAYASCLFNLHTDRNSDTYINAQCVDIYNQLASLNLDPHSLMDHAIITQWMNNYQLPQPSKDIIYTPKNDILPYIDDLAKSKHQLNSQEKFELMAKFAIGLAQCYSPKAVTLCFDTTTDIDAFIKDFTAWVSPQHIDQQVQEKVNAFARIKTRVATQGFFLRTNSTDSTQPLSFARLLETFISDYLTTHRNAQVAPTSLNELVFPTALVFINLEVLSNTNLSDINAQFSAIHNHTHRIREPYELKTITTFEQLQETAQERTQHVTPQGPKDDSNFQRGSVYDPYAQEAPTDRYILKTLQNLINSMTRHHMSHNFVKTTKRTSTKQSRRHSDNIDAPGKITTKKYKPDIHIYADFSGSMSKDHSARAIRLISYLAKKIDADMYFSSFSHNLSEEVKVPVKSKSAHFIERYIDKIPKVGGGTSYEVIWANINNSVDHQRRLNIIITDFEYSPPMYRFNHPDNVVYIPVTGIHWDRIIDNAKHFAESMVTHDPAIRSKLIGI